MKTWIDPTRGGGSRTLRPARWLLAFGLLLLMALWAAAAHAQAEADPPGRVGRLSALNGGVSWFDAEQARWAEASRNRPLTSGDRLATANDGSAVLRIGSTTVRLDAGTEIELQRVDDERVQVYLRRGSLALTVLSAAVATETSFGTDDVWLQPQRGGLFRLDRDDDSTWASSWRGELRVDDDPRLQIESGQRLQLWREGPDRQLRQRWLSPRDDGFAARVLTEDRLDREAERSASARYVSPEMTGFEDLDANGRWDSHPEFGPIWTPITVAADWVPYRQGHWSWVAPWGWTWIDDAPWGFAPFHYGRWVSWRGRWGWIPGPYVSRPVYAPALVGWVGGPSAGIGLHLGGPGFSWVPLAPWESYRPYYRVSPGYRDRINPPPPRPIRPPPGRGGGWGNQGVPGAVTLLPPDRWQRQPPPRPPRDGRDWRPDRPGDWRNDRPDHRDGRPGDGRPGDGRPGGGRPGDWGPGDGRPGDGVPPGVQPRPPRMTQPDRPLQPVRPVQPVQPDQPRPPRPAPPPRSDLPRGEPPATSVPPPTVPHPGRGDGRPPRAGGIDRGDDRPPPRPAPQAPIAPVAPAPPPRPPESRPMPPPRPPETRPQPPQRPPEARPSPPSPPPQRDRDTGDNSGGGRKGGNEPRQMMR